MQYILIRHTTTLWNTLGRIQGITDIPLSPQGRKEAALLAQQLVNMPIDFIVSSDLQRASETGKILQDVLRIPLQFDERLHECAFGSLEGLTREQVNEKYGHLLTPQWEDYQSPYDFRRFGGEHRGSVITRHLDVLSQLAAHNSSNHTVILVGHSRGLNTLLAELGDFITLQRGTFRRIEFIPNRSTYMDQSTT